MIVERKEVYLMKNIVKQVAEWLFCLALGFLIVNILTFGYKRSGWWLNTPNGATFALRAPHSLLINCVEGYSISTIDKNGFSNPDKELAEDYVLMMGASHSVGKEMAPDKKYSVLVNDYLADDDLLHTYNIAMEGVFLPLQIKYFKSGVEAFDRASVVTIEIVGTDYSLEEFQDAIENQVDYDERDTADGFYRLSKTMQIRKIGRSFLPLFALIDSNIEAYRNARAVQEPYEVDETEYKKVINDALALIRSEYDKPIVFIYHPKLAIREDGSIELKYSETWEIFKEACINNNIDVIDSGNDILKLYNEQHKVPYGFSNTSMGTGHLNKAGHEMLAEEIIEYLEELEK